MIQIHKCHQLEKADLVFEDTADPAFMGILDIKTYDSFLRNWDWPSLTTKAAQQMTQERIFAWGCPEYTLRIRITMTAPPKSDFKPVESISGIVTTSGQLCFASYDSLAMCAQFENCHFPDVESRPFSVNPGRYEITVHRMFRWQHGWQFPDSIGDDDHYVVVISAAKNTATSKDFKCVPWVVL